MMIFLILFYIYIHFIFSLCEKLLLFFDGAPSEAYNLKLYLLFQRISEKSAAKLCDTFYNYIHCLVCKVCKIYTYLKQLKG